MKVLRYKYLGSGKYKVTFDNNEIIMFEDVILKYELLTKKEISKSDFDIIIKDNDFYDLYYKAIKYIKIKMRSAKEVKIYLKKYCSSDDYINKIIKKLEDNKIIDQNLYVSSYINDAINLKNVGPNKIKKDLIDLGINIDVIDNYIDVFDKQLVKEKLEKIINKEYKINKKSFLTFKNKMLNKLIINGYNKEDILESLNNYNFDDTLLKQKEYDKLYKKSSNKYSGKELEYIIKQKLYVLGYRE